MVDKQQNIFDFKIIMIIMNFMAQFFPTYQNIFLL